MNTIGQIEKQTQARIINELEKLASDTSKHLKGIMQELPTGKI